MVFSSVIFLFMFLPALLLCYFIIPPKLRGARNFILLIFSLFFYAFGGPKFLILMLVSIALNYVSGLMCGARRVGVRRTGLFLAVIGGLGLLGYFKYAGFAVETLNNLGFAIPVPEITLPIGISFFTFQGLSYVADVYRGEANAEKNPLRVALYIALFPQLVAGPIVRYTTVADEIVNRRENITDFSRGTVRFLFGLAKKMLLANTLGQMADTVFAQNAASLAFSTSWLGALAYTGQIYFDFSAYSDMAIGLGAMFGFHFNENFNYPYVSSSITEFWRRWHISLSSWFRDYVYIPLGGSRCKRSRNIRNILIVWLLTGLWHGASWTFIAWGAFFGVLLLGEKFVWKKPWEKMPSVLRHLLTMILVIVSWVIFRSDTIGDALSYLKTMFTGGCALYDRQGIYLLIEYRVELAVSVVAALPVKVWLERALEKRHTASASAIREYVPMVLSLVLFLLSYMKLVSGSFNPFIYFRF